MRIVSWNVNGLRAAHKKGFLKWLAAEQADVVGVQEVRARGARTLYHTDIPYETLLDMSVAELRRHLNIAPEAPEAAHDVQGRRP